MTYFGFLLRFLMPPILVFLAIACWDNKENRQVNGFRTERAVWTAIGIHILLAVIYTTPWDNYLVATGVWYYNPELVTGIVIGYVPIEEYTFFVLETILSGLWWWFLARRIAFTPRFDYKWSRYAPTTMSTRLRQSAHPRRLLGHRLLSAKELRQNKLLVYLSTCVPALLWLVATYLFFFGEAEWTYLSIILCWALPPLILQLLFGADILWHYRKLVALAILLPGTYLSLIDIVALKETTWSIAASQTTGILFFGILPLEEVLFFCLTNMLITFGMTLLLANISQERFAEIRKQVQAWKERAPDPRSG